MKQNLTIAIIFIASITLSACGNDNENGNNSAANNAGEYDSRAIEALDNLTDVIGELESTSFTLEVAKSERPGDDDWHTVETESDVYMLGPDRFYIHTTGDQINKGIWYNGSELAKYSFIKNTYDSIPVTGNIIEAIDYVHHKYGIDFPAADFFYPTLTDDIIEDFDSVYFMGEQQSGDHTYLLIEASNEDQQLSIWIDKSTRLPSRFEMFSEENKKHYAAEFLNWKINPSIGDVVFDFLAPSDSSRVPLTAAE